jgi:putative transposase
LSESGSQALQYAARALQNGYDNFFRKVKLKKAGKHKGRCGFPRFKKKHGKQSFKVLQNIHIIDDKLLIPKFKEGIPIIFHRPLEGDIKFATVIKNKAGQYLVSITTSREIAPLPEVKGTIGLDLNVHEIVGSDGTKYKNPLPRTKYKNRLRFLTKAAKRTKEGSKGRKKAYLKLNQLERHIHNIREDFQHKVSRKIIDENQIICLESLSVAKMLKNEDPYVREIERWKEKEHHRKLSDACFSSFFQKIIYKALWYGRELRQVDRWFPSSQLCSVCGWQYTELKLEQRGWTCYNCFTMHDRDENAATNIHNEGIHPSWNGGRAVCLGIRPAQSGLLIGTEASPSLAAGQFTMRASCLDS